MPIPSPMQWVSLSEMTSRVLYHDKMEEVKVYLDSGKNLRIRNRGPREKVYFDPSKLKCGIVTCGVCAQGLNDLIRAIVLGCFTTTA